MKQKFFHKKRKGVFSNRSAISEESSTLLKTWRLLRRTSSRHVLFTTRAKKIFYLSIPFLFLASFLGAEQLLPTINTVMPGLVEPKRLNVLMETLLVMTFISFVPAFLMMTTSFLRMIVVLGFLRHAMGTQQTPPNSILISMALLLTFFVMGPTWNQIKEQAVAPYVQKKISWSNALERASNPLKDFMFRQSRKKDLDLAIRLSKTPELGSARDIPFFVLTTGYVLSELKTAFQIGFLIFIPFLVIDMVVASVLMALGMMMVPPTVVSMPLKILLFVMMDGWNLLVEGLVRSVR